MTTTPTASQLWSSTSNFRREGGPGMPEDCDIKYLDHRHVWCVWSSEEDGNPNWNELQSIDLATAILGWHGLMWLHNVGYFTETCDRQKADRWDADDFHHLHDVRFRVKVDKYDEIGSTEFQTVVEGPTMLDAINAAIGAVLDAREGK